MKNIDFTIAVAIYNVEAYLEECIDSIVGQLDDRMELLLVDDGSLDNCGKICDRYAQKDNRIAVIHQKNGGLSAARNTAIAHASGKWIVFVDGDDKLTAGAMAAMKNCSEDTAQLIIFDYVEFDRNGQWSLCRPHGTFVLDTPEMLEQFHASTLHLRPSLATHFADAQCITSWAKMWKLSYIREYGYTFNPAVRRGEDNVFSFSASRNMSRVRVCADCVYAYRHNGAGIIRRFEPRTPEHYRILLSAIQQDMASHGETDSLILRNGFGQLCMVGFAFSLQQTLAHQECRWSRKERIAWLRNLAQEDWIKKAEKNNADTVRWRLMLDWIKKGAYGKIDLCCRAYRILTLAKNLPIRNKP